ncbi:MAG: hypothetical protein E6G56_13520 [Actinobacteria bacterium]|nr:MAG: hypothetical protein E6G56_13520 [Actinomycetota bacterium]
MSARAWFGRLGLGRPSPAMVVAIVALVVAMGGPSIAASGVLIHSSSQVARGAIKGKNIASATITARNLASGSVRPATLDRGLRGLIATAARANKSAGGPAAPAGASGGGAMSSAREVIRKDGPDNQPGGKMITIATMPALDPGVWAIFAKTVVQGKFDNTTDLNTILTRLGQGGDSDAECRLDAAGDQDVTFAPITAPSASHLAGASMQITRSLGAPGDIKVSCGSSGQPWHATNTTIIAIKLSDAPRQEVTG